MASRRRPWTFFFLAAFVIHPALAEPTASDRETARSLLNEGDKKVAAKDYPGALRAYQAAHNIMGVPTTGIEVVKAQVALGLFIEARDTALQITRYPARSNEATPFARARSDAEDLARQLAQRIGAIRVVPQGIAPGRDAEVTIDGNAIAPAAVSLPYKVNPGAHIVIGKTSGYSTERAEVVVREGETKDVTLALKPLSETPRAAPTAALPADAKPEKTTKSNASPLVYIGFGLAAAGVAVGTVTGILSLSKTSNAKDLCTNTTCPPQAKDTIDQAKTMATFSNIGFAAGLVGAGLGVAGLLLGGSKTEAPATAKFYPVIQVNRIGIAGSFLFSFLVTFFVTFFHVVLLVVRNTAMSALRIVKPACFCFTLAGLTVMGCQVVSGVNDLKIVDSQAAAATCVNQQPKTIACRCDVSGKSPGVECGFRPFAECLTCLYSKCDAPLSACDSPSLTPACQQASDCVIRNLVRDPSTTINCHIASCIDVVDVPGPGAVFPCVVNECATECAGIPADGCNPPGSDAFGLAITFQGYGAIHAGTLFRVILEEQESKAIQEIAKIDMLPPNQDAFSVAKNNVLQRGKTYKLLYFADVNKNGTCDVDSVDHVWSEPINAVDKDLRLVFKHNTNFTFSACDALNR